MAGHFSWVLIWTGACYWHGVGGFVFDSSSSSRWLVGVHWCHNNNKMALLLNRTTTKKQRSRKAARRTILAGDRVCRPGFLNNPHEAQRPPAPCMATRGARARKGSYTTTHNTGLIIQHAARRAARDDGDGRALALVVYRRSKLSLRHFWCHVSRAAVGQFLTRRKCASLSARSGIQGGPAHGTAPGTARQPLLTRR